MIILNFAHPLNSTALEALASLLEGDVVGEVKNVTVKVDNERSFLDQAQEVTESVGWTSQQWQTNRFVVVPPGYAPFACTLLANIHGRTGFFPAMLRMKPSGGTPPSFTPAEVLSLHAVREESRERNR